MCIRDSRNVQRLGQRLPDRHRAAIEAVKIHRHVAVERGRPVFDQAFGMSEAKLERQPIDQRLQRRAGRAHRLGHVDIAGALGVEQTGRADRSEDIACLLYTSRCV